MSAVKRKDFETAADAFERAFALQATPNIEYNLAAALFEVGRFVDVQEHLDHVLSEPTLGENVRAAALDLQERVRPHVARLSVNLIVDGQENPQLYVDDKEIPADAWSASRAVEPGLHHVRVLDGFETLAEREISVEAGREATLDLQLVPVPVVVEVPAAAPPPPAPLDEIDVAPSRSRSWKLWVGVSAAVVVSAVALGVGFGLRDKSDGTPPHTDGTLGPGALIW